MRTEREVEEIDKDEASEYQDKKDMETRYEFYQQQCDYFRRLSGYLTDKRKELEEVFKDSWLSWIVVSSILWDL